ncbi:GIY-YIG nuclease family protein [Marinobacterium weihaiense]|uniref:GIY-YIG nuclease family protein n=1 Tax=Marinobacterium weihaiense TaxID=2851016 RepID=A0ABS6M6W6_9GAMM|nr:GIY-YIG nuclease family protein [Marinobacterium weihaiense]MBV0932038.1 GIY-YIG nuclease family protein [Marinobacterium weihaiense]
MIRTRREPPTRRTLDDIFSGDDPLGLLNVTASRASAPTADERLLSGFQAVEAFVSENGREPDQDAEDLQEATMAVRLAAIRANPEHRDTLAQHDDLGLLSASTDTDGQTGTPQPAGVTEAAELDNVSSLDDILDSDPFGLLSVDAEAESIFEMTHVSEPEEKQRPDEIAKRTVCDDFYRFERLFDEVRDAIRNGDAETVPFKKESQIDEGDMFILNGMICIADQVGKESVGAGAKFNPRLRVVFDNGTESNLLLRSLARALYKDETGRRILEQDKALNGLAGLTHKDQQTGIIYILRSLSHDPVLKQVRHLHKIGYTEKDLDKRLAGAERQQTYLEAPVKVVASFDCYNLDPHRFERLIHAMLHNQRVNVTLHSRDGGTYRPREWFDVELDTAREVVKRIIDGSIIQYRMDNTTGRLVEKDFNI